MIKSSGVIYVYNGPQKPPSIKVAPVVMAPRVAPVGPKQTTPAAPVGTVQPKPASVVPIPKPLSPIVPPFAPKQSPFTMGRKPFTPVAKPVVPVHLPPAVKQLAAEAKSIHRESNIAHRESLIDNRITINDKRFTINEEETRSVSYDATSLTGLLQLEPALTETIAVFEGNSDRVETAGSAVITETPRPAIKPVQPSDATPATNIQQVPPLPVVEVKKPQVSPVTQDSLVPQITVKKKKASLEFGMFSSRAKRLAGIALVVLAVIGISIPIFPKAALEARYQVSKIQNNVIKQEEAKTPMPASVPVVFTPLIGPDGKEITPVNTDFSVVIPRLGINSTVIPGVDPLNSKEYTAALEKGVAQARTSYLPDQDGAVYLFSHSTNYAWFVNDLNAVFYQVKDLKEGDTIVVFYKGKRYTYAYVNKTVASPSDTTYLLPITGKKMLILQTCWPPGSTTERLLIFADLVQEPGVQI